MSVNLTFVIDKYGNEPILAYNRIGLNWQDYEAFDKIKIEAIPIIHSIYWYDDEGIEERTTDMYDQPLTYLSAYSLAKHLSTAKLHGLDCAVLAFLKALKPDTKIILWWH